jgi:hypothetical protein
MLSRLTMVGHATLEGSINYALTERQRLPAVAHFNVHVMKSRRAQAIRQRLLRNCVAGMPQIIVSFCWSYPGSNPLLQP